MHADHALPSAAGPGQAAPLQARSSFRQIVDVPFGTRMAALESRQLTGHDGARRRGQLHRDQDEKRSMPQPASPAAQARETHDIAE